MSTDESKDKAASVQSAPWWTWVVLVVILLALAIGGIKSCSDKNQAEKAAVAKYATAAHPPAPAPLAECTTPCTVPVGWGTVMKTGGRPVLIKYHGKTKWIRLSGRENDQITLDQFAPGNAKFASPPEDTTPVQVQIFPPAR